MRYCDKCKKEMIGTPDEVLETPNYRWDICLDCFIKLESKIKDIIKGD